MRAKKKKEKIADALDRSLAVSDRGIIRSADLSRGDREQLLASGYLAEVFKGWYFLTKPGSETGQSTAWYAVFWDFLSVYLREYNGEEYCLSAVSSLDLHLELSMLPAQVIVMTLRGGNRQQPLPFGTSVLMYKTSQARMPEIEEKNGLRVMSLPLALIKLPLTYFALRPIDAEIALRSLKNTADLSRIFMSGLGHGSAGRIIGAYQFLGETRRADELIGALTIAGIPVDLENPFKTEAPVLITKRQVSPYASRIESMFRVLRDRVLPSFKGRSYKKEKVEAYLAHVDAVCQHDAYNSLSIEGYQITLQLIQRIREGAWDPLSNSGDQHEADIFAAQGYLKAFKLVTKSIRSVFAGQDVIDVIEADYSKWYQALFSATVSAGILEPRHLAGFRNGRVFITGSRHIPPPPHAVNDAMDALFACLREEESPLVRAVLGHFLFTFIHPYMDGNGRMGRFFMNVLLAAGDYPWTIIRVNQRAAYMAALEKASCEQEIEPFATFIFQEMSVDWESS